MIKSQHATALRIERERYLSPNEKQNTKISIEPLFVRIAKAPKTLIFNALKRVNKN